MTEDENFQPDQRKQQKAKRSSHAGNRTRGETFRKVARDFCSPTEKRQGKDNLRSHLQSTTIPHGMVSVMKILNPLISQQGSCQARPDLEAFCIFLYRSRRIFDRILFPKSWSAFKSFKYPVAWLLEGLVLRFCPRFSNCGPISDHKPSNFSKIRQIWSSYKRRCSP